MLRYFSVLFFLRPFLGGSPPKRLAGLCAGWDRVQWSDFGKNPGLGHFGRNRPKVATSVPSTCGSPSPCADTSFGHPRECRTLQPPSDFQLILSTRTDVTLALILGPSFYSLLTPSRLGRAHTSTCPAAASRPAHSALARLGTPGCVGSGQRF